MRQAFAALFICLLSSAASAQVTVPNTFTAGSVARASEVNANFTALATAINDLATRVSALETPTIAAATVPGTYKYLSLDVGATAGMLPGGSGALQVTSAKGSGTYVLNAGGSATLSTNDFSTVANIIVSGGSVTAGETLGETGPQSNPATWSVSNGELVITTGLVTDVPVNFVPASSRLFIGTSRNHVGTPDVYSIHILVKQ
jgi:hypothetical protein